MMKKPGESDEEILVSLDTDSEAGIVKSPSSSCSEKSSDQLSLPAGSGEHLNLPVNITTPSLSSRRTSTSSTSLPNQIGNTGRSGAEEVTESWWKVKILQFSMLSKMACKICNLK